MSVLQQCLRIPNTFGVDCYADSFISVKCVADLQLALGEAAQQKMPLLLIGEGSNLLLQSTHMRAVCAQMAMKGRKYREIDKHTWHVTAAAGEIWHELVLDTLAKGLRGLENLSLIPGTVGAAPIQNIGAYGVEVGERIISVDLMEIPSGKRCILSREECRFAYRDSIFKREMKDSVVVLSVTFELHTDTELNTGYETLAREMAAHPREMWTAKLVSKSVIAVRRARLPDPRTVGNAGSFFKNPLLSSERHEELSQRYPDLPVYQQPDGHYKVAAGWLIDQSGLKGWHHGKAGTHEKQALVLINRGGASGEELLSAARLIRDTVAAKFGVVLENEVRILDENAAEIAL